MMSEKRERTEAFAGMALIGSVIVGVFSLILAVITVFGGEPLVAAVSLVAAALSFGLLSTAIFSQ